MLLRVKEETGDEIAGFCAPSAQRLPKSATAPTSTGRATPAATPAVVPAWRRSTLADAGWRVAMTVLDGRHRRATCTHGRRSPSGLPIRSTASTKPRRFSKRAFRLSAVWTLSARGSAELFALRAILGLRSPSIRCRDLVNPFEARLRSSRCSIPATWRWTATPRRCGSAKRARPGFPRRRRRAEPAAEQAGETLTVADGAAGEMRLSSLSTTRAQTRRDPSTLIRPRRFVAWRDARPIRRRFVGTLAIAPRDVGVERDQSAAEARAEALWRARNRRPPAAAAEPMREGEETRMNEDGPSPQPRRRRPTCAVPARLGQVAAVVGGGPVAACRVETLARCSARSSGLRAAPRRRGVAPLGERFAFAHVGRGPTAPTSPGCLVCYVATGDSALDERLHAGLLGPARRSASPTARPQRLHLAFDLRPLALSSRFRPAALAMLGGCCGRGWRR